MLKKLLILVVGIGIALGAAALFLPKDFAAFSQQVAENMHHIEVAGTSSSTASVQLITGANLGILTNDQVIAATNAERAKNGVPALQENTLLDASAEVKVKDMIKNDYFEHTSPAGKTVSDLALGEGYSYVVIGENLALGDFASTDDLMTAWMNSPGHRANILNPHYQDIGVAVAVGTYQGNTVWFAVQHFGTQKDVCPEISATLKQSIATLASSLNTKEASINSLKTVLSEPNAQQNPKYESEVTTFNMAVTAYNALIEVSKQKVSEYNAEVNVFNACLAKYS